METAGVFCSRARQGTGQAGPHCWVLSGCKSINMHPQTPVVVPAMSAWQLCHRTIEILDWLSSLARALGALPCRCHPGIGVYRVSGRLE
jgi:hypothetical protein